MESRISRIFLKVVACLLLLSSGMSYSKDEVDDNAGVVGSAPIIEPFVVRADLKEADIDSENFELGAYFGQISIEELTTIPLMGVSVTFHATEDFFLEANYAIATLEVPNTSKLNQSNTFTDDELVMYNLSLGFDVFPGEVFIGEDWAFNSALYVIAGGGVTQFDSKDEFTVNLGLGYRIILTDWLAFHVDFRDHIFNRKVANVERKSQNFDFHTGVTFFF